jgi:tRNA dimethylallyltransferase
MQRAQKSGGTRQVLLIAGPTASGKSSLAVALAERLEKAVIINADSMQIYRDLRIVTARPTPQEESRLTHFCSGTIDGSSGLSVAVWRDKAARVLEQSGDKPAIFVGGTGLYFRALTDGLAPIPDIPDAIRREVRARLAQEGPVALHAELDEAMADQLSPTDSQRVARALEVLLATGQSLAAWQKLPPEGAVVALDQTRHVVLDPPRDWLEARIRARAQTMLFEEALDEVRALRARDLSPDLPVMRAIGVSVISAYLDGDMTRADALDALTIETRRYAKRQATWFRGQMGDWPRLDPSRMSVDAMADWMLNEENACAHGF